MKKILLFALNFFVCNNYAQTTKISFEENEGFISGPLNNQKGWFAYHIVDDDFVAYDGGEISKEKQSDGENSLYLIPTSTFGFKGVLNKVSPIYDRTKISMDIFLEPKSSDLMSDIVLSLKNQDSLALASINFSGFDDKIYAGVGDFLEEIPNSSFETNQWLNVTFEIDQTKKNSKIYLESTKILDNSFAPFGGELSFFDLFMIDLGTSFYIDNIRISQLDILSTNENSSTELEIYPNPSHDYIHLKTKEKVETLLLFDAYGKYISLPKTNQQTIDIQHLENGIYYLQLKTPDSVIIKRIIKK
ncbi:Por secretion system C-terminal sorting domain [Weeksella virosa]|uniref:T9SS type A sorting domain-containing protein n=1 Tax=Weeksella virosa TaxID=1014 RepID=UPI000E02A10F|nr:T9SS type A sorting domain-containing protein [Weeksella virosa]SUP54817.1 Por secretion system C-terminal sorting domain [Weeksella virosa]